MAFSQETGRCPSPDLSRGSRTRARPITASLTANRPLTQAWPRLTGPFSEGREARTRFPLISTSRVHPIPQRGQMTGPVFSGSISGRTALSVSAPVGQTSTQAPQN